MSFHKDSIHQKISMYDVLGQLQLILDHVLIASDKYTYSKLEQLVLAIEEKYPKYYKGKINYIGEESPTGYPEKAPHDPKWLSDNGKIRHYHDSD